MPLIEVHLERELFEARHPEIGRELQLAQIEALGTAEDDVFQVFNPHGPEELKFDPGYGGVDRRSLMVIRVTLVHKHTVAKKRALYRGIVERLAVLGIRPEDIQIAMVENTFEDWYAGSL